jgi:2-(1,2-epoxy-1,2-dihydrophenyl)acetyl-CoA isomerase
MSAARDESGVAVERDGPVLRIRLCRPERRNALPPAGFVELADAVEAANDDEVRVITLEAEGDHFCSGADLVASNAPRAERPRTGHMVRGLARGAHRGIRSLYESPLPVVAVVRGHAVGFGCNLALAADFVIASDTAIFSEPFVQRGLTPDSAGTWILPRLVGLARARRMLLLGERVGASDAEAWGLIHEVVEGDALAAHAEAFIQKLATGPTLSLGLTKSLLHRGLTTDVAAALENEAYAEELAIRSKDFKAGLLAFREKRSPEYEGR